MEHVIAFCGFGGAYILTCDVINILVLNPLLRFETKFIHATHDMDSYL